jgi:SAM-dependent methyltransferase
MPTADEILAIAKGPLRLSEADVDTQLHLFSPKARFLKTLPAGATVLDLGAGGGGAINYRSWPDPPRDDLRFYAVDMEKGELFDRYDGYELVDFNRAKPDFDGRLFDAIYTVHFAEHVEDGPAGVAAWAASRLRPGGKLYLELPSKQSERGPRRVDLLAGGLSVSTTNFFDDSTHIQTLTLPELTAAVSGAGLNVVESGIWQNDFLADELIRRADAYRQTMGVWLKCGFCQYVIATKVA